MLFKNRKHSKPGSKQTRDMWEKREKKESLIQIFACRLSTGMSEIPSDKVFFAGGNFDSRAKLQQL